MNKLCYLSVLLFTLLAMPLVSFAHCADKHTGNHPHCRGEEPPPPPPESCAGAPGVFPSFAYSKPVYGGKHGSVSAYELYLANSTGECSILLHTNQDDSYLDITYRQIGTAGRILWRQNEETNLPRRSPLRWRRVVKLLDFTVTNGQASNVALSTAYMMPESQYATALYDVVLSPDGNTAYFADEIFIGTASVDNLSTIKALDVSSCTSGCDAPTLASTVTGPLKTFMALTINPAGTHLYYTRHGFPTVIGMIEVLPPGATRLVASEEDSLYWDEKFVELASGTGRSGEDLIAVQLDDIQNTIDIIDVTNCTADGSISSCIAVGDATIYITGIPRGTFSFHGPDLLIDRDGGIDLFHTDTLSYIGLIEGVGVGSPDSAE
jgi:hypothetical protein